MDKILAIALPFLMIPISMIYLILRSKMTKPKIKDPTYSTLRVLKIININFFLNMTVMFVNLYVTANIFSRIVFNPISIFFLALYILSILIVIYGCGIYVTTIVLNCYLKDPITNAGLKADHLLHGVISHVLIFSGWLLAMFFQGILEVNFARPELTTLELPLLISGLVFGFIFAILQIVNDTYIYQMMVGLATALIFYINIFANGIIVFDHPYGGYYLGFIFVCSSILLSHVCYRLITKKKISWNRSKYAC